MITLMHTLFYELSDNTVSSVLILFIISVGLSYISGLFYPIGFFPEAIQKISAYLPTGAGFGYLRNTLTGTLSVKDILSVLAYSFIFILLTVKIRKIRMGGGICE